MPFCGGLRIARPGGDNGDTSCSMRQCKVSHISLLTNGWHRTDTAANLQLTFGSAGIFLLHPVPSYLTFESLRSTREVKWGPLKGGSFSNFFKVCVTV